MRVRTQALVMTAPTGALGDTALRCAVLPPRAEPRSESCVLPTGAPGGTVTLAGGVAVLPPGAEPRVTQGVFC